jgi:serine/threonine protein kinase
VSFGPGAEVWTARLGRRQIIARRHVQPTGSLPWPVPPSPDVLRQLNHPTLARFLGTMFDPDAVRIDLFVPVPGPTLREAVGHAPLATEVWVPALRSAAVGLRWLHVRSPASPRLHGDVAPSNLILSGAGRARWIDTGAFVPGVHPAGRGVVWGSLSMLAPEVLEGGAPGRPAEVHALALLALVAALGRLPWSDASTPAALLEHPARRAAEELARAIDAPAAIRDLLARMLAWDPAARPGIDAVVAAWPRG